MIKYMIISYSQLEHSATLKNLIGLGLNSVFDDPKNHRLIVGRFGTNKTELKNVLSSKKKFTIKFKKIREVK